MPQLKTIKATALAVLIVVGLGVQNNGAKASDKEVLTVAGGCFWCVESDFERVAGVKDVVSGFTGGTVADPTYKQVVRGGTGHYEAVQITFDPARVTRNQILSMFFRSVDPTDGGGQFCDRGDAYRTAIFPTNEDQRIAAERAKADAEAELGQKIVTPIMDGGAFYEAEAYHQDYYKSDQIIITRFGPRSKASAYKSYRKACGRDQRVDELWGDAAPFTGS
ncbi:MAG: peptide-methionine (S)-S-oxide reductase MsrA [Pseudomonadota bacterium]